MWHMTWHTCGVNGTTKDIYEHYNNVCYVIYNIDDSLHVIFNVRIN
jgi:hypothetical protein